MRTRNASDPLNYNLLTEPPIEVLLDCIFPRLSSKEKNHLNSLSGSLIAYEVAEKNYHLYAKKMIQKYFLAPCVTITNRPVLRWNFKGVPQPKTNLMDNEAFNHFITHLSS